LQILEGTEGETGADKDDGVEANACGGTVGGGNG
jgi:hypothetical protein